MRVLLGDPEAGLRWQAGVGAGARLGLGGGFALAGSVAQALAGNLDEGLPSDSLLPHVRSDIAPLCAGGPDLDPRALCRADLDPGAGCVRAA